MQNVLKLNNAYSFVLCLRYHSNINGPRGAREEGTMYHRLARTLIIYSAGAVVGGGAAVHVYSNRVHHPTSVVESLSDEAKRRIEVEQRIFR